MDQNLTTEIYKLIGVGVGVFIVFSVVAKWAYSRYREKEKENSVLRKNFESYKDKVKEDSVIKLQSDFTTLGRSVASQIKTIETKIEGINTRFVQQVRSFDLIHHQLKETKDKFNQASDQMAVHVEVIKDRFENTEKNIVRMTSVAIAETEKVKKEVKEMKETTPDSRQVKIGENLIMIKCKNLK